MDHSVAAEIQREYQYLKRQQEQHAAWRLLRAQHAPLIIVFLQRSFIQNNVQQLPHDQLLEKLKDVFYALNSSVPDFEQNVTGSEEHYLREWSHDDKGWLRKFYVKADNVPRYELTSAAATALKWLQTLNDFDFVGAESRLKMIFNLLEEMAFGGQNDPQKQLQELKRQREVLDQEIARVASGSPLLLDDTALRERFQQFQQQARELLSDFAKINENFRSLDRQLREDIMGWEQSKAELLSWFFTEDERILDTDQGRSFKAFQRFLLQQAYQDEFKQMLSQVTQLPAIKPLVPQEIDTIYSKWSAASANTQRLVAGLSQQLSQFVRADAWQEERRIRQIIDALKKEALQLASDPPQQKAFMSIEHSKVYLSLPMERSMHAFQIDTDFSTTPTLAAADTEIPLEFFQQSIITQKEVADRVQHLLNQHEQITLPEILAIHPLSYGLAELLLYIKLLDHSAFLAEQDPAIRDKISWPSGVNVIRQIHWPRITFRKAPHGSIRL